MKKIATLLIVLFSFFIASREVFAQDPTNCNSSAVRGYNALESRTVATLEKVCSYQPLGINPSDLNSPNGISYIEIFNLQNGNGDIYYFMEVNQKMSGKTYKMLACAIKKPNGDKEAHSENNDGVESRIFSADNNEIFQTINPGDYGNTGVNGGSIYEFVDGYEGVTGLSESAHDNMHICPLYAGKIYAPEADGYDAGYSLALIPTGYTGVTEWPTVANSFSNFTTEYHGGLTWHAENATYDAFNASTGTYVGHVVSHTNNTITSATSNSEIINDWDSCNQYGVLKTLDIVHTALLILRIMVPLVLIILGTIDFGKAGISGDDDLVTKATKTIIRRAILGVVIFFIPTLMYAFANLAGDRNNSESSDFYKCTDCFTGDQSCDGYLQSAEGKIDIN